MDNTGNRVISCNALLSPFAPRKNRRSFAERKATNHRCCPSRIIIYAVRARTSRSRLDERPFRSESAPVSPGGHAGLTRLSAGVAAGANAAHFSPRKALKDLGPGKRCRGVI
jgi:hypothetical protein